MELPIIFENDTLDDKKDSYLLALEKAYDNYMNEIENDIKNDKVKSEIKKICDTIKKSYKQWCCGDCQQALNTLKYVLKKRMGCDKLKIGFKDLFSKSNSNSEVLYKARIADPNSLELKEDDMLHIPLNRRYLVQNQRFSIAGCPCIYMCNNSYTCWTELGKPEFSRFYVSAIKITQQNKMQLLNLYDDGTTFSGDRLYVFPLIIAISFKNYDNKRKFKPEYVISSMIMILLSHLGCDGVIYSSNCAPHYTTVLNMNIAIPVKGKETDKCFFVGSPHNFRDFELLGEFERISGTKRQMGPIDFQYVQICKKMTQYHCLDFSLFDNYISGRM